MRFEWDPEKARRNLAKHRVGFELARRVWDDPLCVITDDAVVDGERRLRAIGSVSFASILLVVHVHPDPMDEDRVRIISARKATPHERRLYEEQAF